MSVGLGHGVVHVLAALGPDLLGEALGRPGLEVEDEGGARRREDGEDSERNDSESHFVGCLWGCWLLSETKRNSVF